ncbi:MAG: hypothetical protein ACUVSW_19245, partial [Roseiflexus sp.]
MYGNDRKTNRRHASPDRRIPYAKRLEEAPKNIAAAMGLDNPMNGNPNNATGRGYGTLREEGSNAYG